LIVIASFIFTGDGMEMRNEREFVRLLFLQQRVLEFAAKYRNQDTIVVSKQDHLLYYCQNGAVVSNFPVRCALSSRYFKTPEGEFQIETKNSSSRYILFLGFKGNYGIHSAPTAYRSYLEKMEALYPNFTFATKKDDTRGCVQVENRVIKYLFARVDEKTPVLIMP
jgi:lipoprotein-anchoring transpeptidase ErfK/SrfK